MSIQRAVTYFKSVGWTTAQAAGIAANLQAESGFRPDAVGDGGLAYGIAQWHPDRQQYFASVAGKSIVGSSLDEQLAFVHAELITTERVAGNALRACVTAAEAGACVSKMYERPADREGEAAKRATLAMKIAGEQPAAPIKDRSTEFQPREETPMGAALLIPLIQTLIGAFAQPAQQKLQSALTKLGADSTAAAPIISGVVDAISKATGISSKDIKENPQVAITAVNAVQVDQQKLAAVADDSVALLDRLAPTLEKLHQYSKDEWEASQASTDSARVDNNLQTPEKLRGNPAFLFGCMIMGVVAFVVTSVLWKDVVLYWVLPKEMIDKLDHVGFSTDMQSFVIGAIVGSALTQVLQYVYGTNRQSAAKDVTIQQITKPR